MRITGLMSGMDIDQTVKDLMKLEYTKVDKVKQQKQYEVWKQDAFRSIINKLGNLKSKYFDIAKQDNLLSSKTFSQGISSAKIGATDTNIIGVSGLSESTSAHEISEITQLASKDIWNGSQVGLNFINTSGLNMSAVKSDGLDFVLSINGNTKTISIDQASLSTVNTIDDLKNTINSAISSKFGSDYSNIVQASGSELNFKLSGSSIKIFEVVGKESSIVNLGVSNGANNLDYKTKSIKDLLGITNTDLSNVSINGVNNLDLKETDTVAEFMSKINKSTANVSLTYNELNDKFVLTSNLEGTANNISFNTEASTLFEKIGVKNDAGHLVGNNAKFVMDGINVTMDKNNFVVDGINIQLNNTYNGNQGVIKISSKVDTTQLVDFVKDFVKDYNSIIDELNTKLFEKRDYNYKPLTDSQKESMKEEDIKTWENKVKVGILANSKELRSLLSKLKNSFVDPIDGMNKGLSDIGIKSSASMANYGKLEIDENKLKQSIESDYNNVVKIFTKTSQYQYGDEANKTNRYNESGVSHRISDLLKDFVSTVALNSSGRKGLLIEIAGKEDDISAFNNRQTDKIKSFDTTIDKLMQKMLQKEEKYYRTFSAMEQAMAKLNSQAAFFSQQNQ